MTATIYVSKEESAKDIDVDVSTNALKLVSEQYVIFFLQFVVTSWLRFSKYLWILTASNANLTKPKRRSRLR